MLVIFHKKKQLWHIAWPSPLFQDFFPVFFFKKNVSGQMQHREPFYFNFLKYHLKGLTQIPPP